MNARQRSLSGLLLAIILIPVLAGLLACIDLMPAPVGNPEKARIDPWLTGLWLAEDQVWVFDPYDKRTWLMSIYSIEERQSCSEPDASEGSSSTDDGEGDFDDEEEIEFDAPEEWYAWEIAQLRSYGEDCYDGSLEWTYKVWITEIGRAEFMTLESKGAYSEDTGFTPQEWLVMRMMRESDNILRLRFLDPDFDEFDSTDVQDKLARLETEEDRNARTLKSARRAVERVIRRNVDNDALYLEGEPGGLARILPQDYDLFINEVVAAP